MTLIQAKLTPESIERISDDIIHILNGHKINPILVENIKNELLSRILNNNVQVSSINLYPSVSPDGSLILEIVELD